MIERAGNYMLLVASLIIILNKPLELKLHATIKVSNKEWQLVILIANSDRIKTLSVIPIRRDIVELNRMHS